MKYKLIFIGLFILILAISYYWSIKSCSYCFQSYISQEYLFEDKDINFSSEYIDNTINIVKHGTNNIIGRFVGNILIFDYLNLVFWIFIATFTTYLFYNKIFNLETGTFAAFIFLTNPTLNVIVHTIVYYFISLFLIYKFLTTKKLSFLFGFLLVLLISFNVDVSPSFVILISSFFLVLFYYIINYISTRYISKEAILSFCFFIIIFIIIITFERNFVLDLLSRIPLIFDKLIFYLSSYPKTAYFYLYIVSRVILIVIPIFYVYNIIKNKLQLTKKETFIFSYFLTVFPLLILFILFDISARIFDYYAPLLAAISFRESKIFLKKEIRDKIIVSVVIFFTLFSIFLHHIPPRSLEIYDNDLLDGLNNLPKDSIVYTDVFVANILITKLDHLSIVGPDFNKGNEYNKVYYEKDVNYIKKLFIDKNVEYFIISRQSLIRGLDILNAPHILKPITIIEYDNMEFLDKYYSNDEVYIWRIDENSSIS